MRSCVGRWIGLGAVLFIGIAALPVPAATPYHYFRPDITRIAVRPVAYRDLDGDHDGFPDTGETGRLVVSVQNTGPALPGLIAVLSSPDTRVDCVLSASVLVGDLPTGARTG